MDTRGAAFRFVRGCMIPGMCWRTHCCTNRRRSWITARFFLFVKIARFRICVNSVCYQVPGNLLLLVVWFYEDHLHLQKTDHVVLCYALDVCPHWKHRLAHGIMVRGFILSRLPSYNVQHKIDNVQSISFTKNCLFPSLFASLLEFSVAENQIMSVRPIEIHTVCSEHC